MPSRLGPRSLRLDIISICLQSPRPCPMSFFYSDACVFRVRINISIGSITTPKIFGFEAFGRAWPFMFTMRSWLTSLVHEVNVIVDFPLKVSFFAIQLVFECVQVRFQFLEDYGENRTEVSVCFLCVI